MTIWHLAFKELLHRKVNFGLSVFAVAVAVGCLSGALALLRAHDHRTDEIIAVKETETRKQMAKLEDDYRKITKNMGFNVLILPKDQNLSDLYADDYALKTIPEEYATRLARSKVVTIQHLMPTLQQKLRWPEQQRTILMVGTRGEVPMLQADPKKPILDAVAKGEIVLGYELHHTLNLKAGSSLKLLGREFKVGKCYPERGTKDDITVWINLQEAQELLNKKGLINGILALECVCAADSLAKVRAEIAGILPDTQVIEFASQALARAEARQRAATAARDAVESEKLARARLRRERESFAAILAPVSLLGAAVWVGFLALGNVRARQTEIGILRAIGVRSSQILWLFLAKAVLIGFLGACVGLVAGLGAVPAMTETGKGALTASVLCDPKLMLLTLLAAPALSAVASWIPAWMAARQDPADILREA